MFQMSYKPLSAKLESCTQSTQPCILPQVFVCRKFMFLTIICLKEEFTHINVMCLIFNGSWWRTYICVQHVNLCVLIIQSSRVTVTNTERIKLSSKANNTRFIFCHDPAERKTQTDSRASYF